MSVNRSQMVKEAQACLGRNAPAGELVECVSQHFPDVEANRQGDDLVIKGGLKFLVIKRTGPDRFLITRNIAAPSTNAVDAGAGTEYSLDQLIDEIATLAD
jgi:hypothetical protein